MESQNQQQTTDPFTQCREKGRRAFTMSLTSKDLEVGVVVFVARLYNDDASAYSTTIALHKEVTNIQNKIELSNFYYY